MLSTLTLRFQTAGDADSIISAIGWAYTERLAEGSTSNNNTTILTPVISIPAHDLATQRPETTLLLEWAGIQAAEYSNLLLFVDDIPRATDQDDESSGWNVTLMDHNRLSSKSPLSLLRKKLCVVEIVDHHMDEGHHRDTCRDRRNIAFANNKATVASTCTLVVERLLQACNNRNSSNNDSIGGFPAPLSLLLLGVILLDSVNLQPAAGKVTLRDREAVQTLLERTDWTELPGAPATLSWMSHRRSHNDDNNGEDDNHSCRPDTTALFEALQNAKFDPTFWQSLSVRDALRLDYKSFSYRRSDNSNNSVFGVSTVLLPLFDFWQKENLTDSIRSYMRERRIDFLGIMLSFTTNDGSMQRQLILCGNEHFTAMNDLVQFVQQPSSSSSGSSIPLELSEIMEQSTEAEGLTLYCFHQGNAKASRKQVAPLLLQFFEQESGEIYH